MKKRNILFIALGLVLLLSLGGTYLYIQFGLLPEYWNRMQVQAAERGLLIETEKLRWKIPFTVSASDLSVSDSNDRILFSSEKAHMLLSPRSEIRGIGHIIDGPGSLDMIREISFINAHIDLNVRDYSFSWDFQGFFRNSESPEFLMESENIANSITFDIGNPDKGKLIIQSKGILDQLTYERLSVELDNMDYSAELEIPYPFHMDNPLAGALDIRSVEMSFPLLSRSLILLKDLAFEAQVDSQLESGELKSFLLQASEIAMGELKGYGRFSYDGDSEFPLIEGEIHLPSTDTQNIVDSMPEAFLGNLSGLELSGDFAWKGGIYLPLNNLDEMTWESIPQLEDFDVLKIPGEVNVFAMEEAFIHHVTAPDGERYMQIPEHIEVSMDWMTAVSEHTPSQTRYWRNFTEANKAAIPEILLSDKEDGPVYEDYRYVRMDEMSLWIPKAVLTGEDGDFFFHNGINWLTFRHALERNFRTGEVQLGASTITMQLIKNLYLSQRQTVVRKLQEAFLVYLTEMEVPIHKERIFEIYLNIAEFGPGIYGINHAAQHFFGKDPKDITLGEAVYLTSILPGPSPYYSIYKSGEIDAEWFRRMKYYFNIMLERKRISREEYNEVIVKPPVFHIPSPE